MKTTVWTITVLFLLAILNNCGDGSGGDNQGSSSGSGSWSSLYPDSFAVSSILSSGSGSSIVTAEAPSELGGDESLAEKAAFLEAIAEGSSGTGCRIALPTNLNGFSGSADCYGPQVNYANHPDGVGGSGNLPTGDLGLWEATEGATTEACAAAQINTLMTTTSKYIDAALMVEASSLCVLDSDSVAIPGVGSTVTFTESFEDSIQADNPSATVSSATVTQESTGVYLFNITGTTDGVKAYTVNVKLKKTSDTDYEGKIYGYFTSMDKDAFSASFTRDGSDLAVRMLAGSWLTSVDDTDIIDTNGDLKLDESWNGNMNQAIINMNVDTQVGSISYGWQAGPGDDKIRVFNAYSAASGSTVTGCGFFGYGNEFVATYASNTNAIDGFICNWAGPGNDHSMATTSNKAQKQCFTRNNSTGVFEEVGAKTAITYAPTVSCDDTDGAFTYDWPTHSGDAATNDLVNTTTDTDYSSYTAPTAPTLSI
ncbi:MAG: hypothetical protein H6621_04860 [Halobacteriovoraceae bacterium]|nr:hypothetical protein [Halobacteriovoraceae bacterium]